MNDDSFIDSVGSILSRGCHADGCSDLDVRMSDDRKANFNIIINNVFGIDGIKLPTNRPTLGPIPDPTPQPLDQISITPKPTPQPFNPLPIPQPFNPSPTPPFATPRPTPQPVDSIFSPPNPLPPAPPPPPRPTDRPTFRLAPLPTKYPTPYWIPQTPRPTYATPMPIGMEVKPIDQPFNGDTNGQKEKPNRPINADKIIPLEGNGAERSMLLKYGHVIFGAAFHLLLTMV